MRLAEWTFQRVVPPVCAGGVLIALWYIIKSAFSVHDFILPAPHQVIIAFADNLPVLLGATGITTIGALIGFMAAFAGGFLAGLLLSSFDLLKRGLYPYVLLLQMSPLLATAAIVVIFFDVGIHSVATIAFLIGFFPVLASTLQGLKSVPREELDLFRLYRASFLQELFLLRIPHSLPYVFTGAKIAATLAVIGAVTGEIFAGSGAQAGLGFLIISYKAELKIDALYAATLVCCLLGFVFVSAVLCVRHAFLHKWHESARNPTDE